MIDNTQPIQYDIEIKKWVIRTNRDIITGVEYACLIAIDENGKEHGFEYRDVDGEYYYIAVNSPNTGKVATKIILGDDDR